MLVKQKHFPSPTLKIELSKEIEEVEGRNEEEEARKMVFVPHNGACHLLRLLDQSIYISFLAKGTIFRQITKTRLD